MNLRAIAVYDPQFVISSSFLRYISSIDYTYKTDQPAPVYSFIVAALFFVDTCYKKLDLIATESDHAADLACVLLSQVNIGYLPRLAGSPRR
jgi:hypothetical protein